MTNQLDFSALKARQKLIDCRDSSGHWIGELSASALSTATAVSALSFYLQSVPKADDRVRIEQQINMGICWLMQQQNDDGGWGDTCKNYSNISTTMLVIAALNASGKVGEFSFQVDNAHRYVDRHGGIVGIRERYGQDKTFAVPILANAAMAGIVDWKEVGVLPFEAACVPQRFYHLLNLPVVSYAIPALVAIGQAKFHFDPPGNPLVRWIRKSSIERSLRVLERMQPESGGYLEAIPLTSFVCMALIKTGRADHKVVDQGVGFLLNSFRAGSDGTGTWPIDTNLATWVTTLSINALARDQEFEFDQESWKPCLQWILDCQNKTVHPFTGSRPGGWGWTDLSGSVPDADDTPGALLALKHLLESGNFTDQTNRIVEAARNGVDWLHGLQNRDGGWPTFCRGWGRLPFDRSGSDLTAHVIRAFVAWQDFFDDSRMETAIKRGFRYLEKNQQSDGSWLPLWFGNQDQTDDINPFYGTAKVLQAYNDSGLLHTNAAQNGLRWIKENQNADGGWGGGSSVRFSKSDFSNSSVEETSLCVEALVIADDEASRKAVASGLAWIQTAVEKEVVGECTPIGFYFAKLWYFEKLYPLIFATSALSAGKNLNMAEAGQETKLDSIHR